MIGTLHIILVSHLQAIKNISCYFYEQSMLCCLSSNHSRNWFHNLTHQFGLKWQSIYILRGSSTQCHKSISPMVKISASLLRAMRNIWLEWVYIHAFIPFITNHIVSLEFQKASKTVFWLTKIIFQHSF